MGADIYTKLLLHCNGADTSTTFTDSSPSAHTITVAGDAQIDTAQSKFGGASALFDGTGDRLNVDGSSDFAFGTGDFVVDLWFRASVVTTSQCLIDFGYTTNPNMLLYVESSLVKLWAGNGDDRIHASVSATTWTHVAIVRSSGKTKLFVNGVDAGTTYTDTNNYSAVTDGPFIGRQVDGGSPYGVSGGGWMDEIRITKGTDRGWFMGFTPPTCAYPNASPEYLLDAFPNAALAYSMRKLKSDYAGSAVRIRRASDNAEADVGFRSDGRFDWAAAGTHISGTTGFITKWYDQSGNGFDAVHATATNQPAYGTSLIRSMHAIDCADTDNYLRATLDGGDMGSGTNTTAMMVWQIIEDDDSEMFYLNNADFRFQIGWPSFLFDMGGTGGTGRLSDVLEPPFTGHHPEGTGPHISTCYRDVSDNQGVQFDGVHANSSPASGRTDDISTGSTSFDIGSRGGSAGTRKYMGELVIWDNDLGSTNRPLALANIATHWQIARLG